MTPRSSASVVITGCSSGDTGHALAARFYQEGLTIFASSRTISKIEELSTLPYVTLVQLDVASLPRTKNMGYLGPNLNIFTSLVGVKKNIINISSIGGCMNIPWVEIYAEAALNKLGETLRLGLLLLTGIAGTVSTNIFDNASSVALPAGSIYHPYLNSIERQEE